MKIKLLVVLMLVLMIGVYADSAKDAVIKDLIAQIVEDQIEIDKLRDEIEILGVEIVKRDEKIEEVTNTYLDLRATYDVLYKYATSYEDSYYDEYVLREEAEGKLDKMSGFHLGGFLNYPYGGSVLLMYRFPGRFGLSVNIGYEKTLFFGVGVIASLKK